MDRLPVRSPVREMDSEGPESMLTSGRLGQELGRGNRHTL